MFFFITLEREVEAKKFFDNIVMNLRVFILEFPNY
jgi:hypothetical protein